MSTDPVLSRRRLLASLGTAAIGSPMIASRTRGATVQQIQATPIADGLTSPLGVIAPPGEAGRYLVADQAGVIERIEGGELADEPFLDVRDRMVDVGGGYSERGLLGFALHPEYAQNRRVFVRYSAPRRTGTPSSYSHTFVLAEFQANAAGETVDPASERTLLEIPQPQSNHNAGSVAFGPDGYLYVGVGDGGGANDQGTGHASDWYGENAGGNGQDLTTNLLGSLLRIDVDNQDGHRPYAIPPDNPLVDHEGFDEHYAWGLRNPWRFSFDGSDLYVADVGQNLREEINLVEKGGNYGWNVREGTACFSTANPSSPPDSCPTTGPGRPTSPEPLEDPIIEYTHADDGDPGGLAVIGGYRYRGSALPGLEGAYLFTDYAAQGRLFVSRPTGDGGTWPINVRRMAAPDGSLGQYVLGFGRDRDGEILVCSTDRGGVVGESGAIHRLSGIEETTVTTTQTPAQTTTSGGSGPGFGTLGTLAGLGGLAAWAYARTDRIR